MPLYSPLLFYVFVVIFIFISTIRQFNCRQREMPLNYVVTITNWLNFKLLLAQILIIAWVLDANQIGVSEVASYSSDNRIQILLPDL